MDRQRVSQASRRQQLLQLLVCALLYHVSACATSFARAKFPLTFLRQTMFLVLLERSFASFLQDSPIALRLREGELHWSAQQIEAL